MNTTRLILALLLLFGLGIPAAQADEIPNPLVDTIEVKLGGYFTTLDTKIRLDVNHEDLGTIINLEAEKGEFTGDLDFIVQVLQAYIRFAF